ncbi:SulP family inorganic anion transporter [Fulvivirga lutea]|uniref:Sulfate permease n=1 Tax=Fulvivirga lutea TaxID=2810512 RepID=A0A974WIX2_9BACT|nr:sulfate permease [Fulvivirga lutea]QSE98749.1 sulfate permease [Fulvivirga lutea]
MKKFFPIIEWLPKYSGTDLKGDLFAGLTVGVMLIPQGMAYALIAGLPPVYGLYASIVPQIIYAFFGTSRQLSVAPVAMDSLMVAAGVSVMATQGTEQYITYAILLAFFMGLFQLLLGVFRMGFITNLLSKPVINGFTSAAAIIIGLNQLKYLMGVEILKSNKVYLIVWDAIQKINETHITTLLLGVAGIVLIKLVKRLNSNIPGSLLAVIVGIGVVVIFSLDQTGVAVVREIPSGLPSFILPSFDLETISSLLPLALTISIVAFMEAYSVSKALETKSGDHKVKANQELIGLGAANVIGSLFQSYPVTGGFSRSAVNYQAGAKTPMASVISAVLIALTLLFLTPLFYYLPEAILASVIMVAVSGLIDVSYIKQLWHDSKVDFALLMATLLITLNFSMVPGIVSGVVLSILVLLYRTAYPHIARLGKLKGFNEYRNLARFRNLEVWDELLIMRVDAPITFINIQFVKDYIENAISSNPKIERVIIDAGPVSMIDATAAQGIREIHASLKEKNIRLSFSDVIGPVRDVFYKIGLMDELGEDNIFLTLNSAVNGRPTETDQQSKEYATQHGILENHKN